MNKIIYALLPFFLLGCSRQQSEPNGQPSPQSQSTQPNINLPAQITFIETAETKEQNGIKSQAMIYLESKDYAKLEDLAAKYRVSKECYADGTWKLAFVYDGVDSTDQSSDSAWENLEKQIQDWVQTRPESITARITMGRFLRNYAWKARGNGNADTVTDESWQLFTERLNKALDVLNEAKNIKETCPVYWSTLLGVDLGLPASKKQFSENFIQAIQAEKDYNYYYRTRAVFLLPRWYGEEGEWEKDLSKSADLIGGEKGDMLYAQIIWDMHSYLSNSKNIFAENNLSWPRVDRGFQVILKQFPASLAAKNERFQLAALSGDWQAACKYFAETRGQADLSVWTSKEEFLRFADWVQQQQ